MMKILGFKRSNISRTLTGYEIYISYPLIGNDAEGLAATRYYVTDEKLAECGYSPRAGDKVNVSFDSQDKIASIALAR